MEKCPFSKLRQKMSWDLQADLEISDPNLSKNAKQIHPKFLNHLSHGIKPDFSLLMSLSMIFFLMIATAKNHQF